MYSMHIILFDSSYFLDSGFHNSNYLEIKQARNPGTVEKRIANSDGRTGGLTD